MAPHLGVYETETRPKSSHSLTATRESVVGFLLWRGHQVDAAAFVQPAFVQLGNNLLHRFGHSLEIPLSTAVNEIGALGNHIAMPVGPSAPGGVSARRTDTIS